jgi:glycosyltransferase involved in cell wall biosynthesis
VDSGRPRTVWIVNHYASPPDQPTGSRHFELARALVRRGHTVTVFASGSGHLPAARRRLRPGRLYRSELYDGVRFVWLWTVPYQGNGLRRQFNMLSFLATFLVVQTRYGMPDDIVGSTVHPFAALGALMAARLRGARFIFEVRDLWPQTLVDLGALRVGSPGERLLRSIEALLVRQASTVITLLPGMRDYLMERGLPWRHVVYIPNGADLVVFSANAPSGDEPASVAQCREEVRRLKSDGRFVVGYLGSFGRVNRLDVVVAAGAIAEERAPGRIWVLLVGGGPERAQLERRAASHANVAFGPAVPKKFVPSILRTLDTAVVHVTYTPVYRYGISFNKLFEYMAAERPVIFACDSAYDPVETSGAGLTVPPDDPERLADAFLVLAALTPDQRREMGSAGRSFVAREHDSARLGELFAAVIEGRSLPTDGGPGGSADRRPDAGEIRSHLSASPERALTPNPPTRTN